MRNKKVIYVDSQVGAFIKSYLDELCLTQRAICPEDKNFHSYVSDLITGRVSLNRRFMDILISRFDLSPSDVDELLACASHDYLKYKKLID